MLLILAIIAMIVEALQVAYTISVAKGRKVRAALSSGMIELSKMISIIIVVDSSNKIINMIILAVVCGIGTYVSMLFIGRDYNDTL
jgi:uncharacterized protein YebE (UPF0316 family)